MNLQISVWQIPQMLISLGKRTKLKHGMFTRTTKYGDEMHYHWPCWDASACCRCLRKWGSSQLKVWSTSFSMTSAMNMSGKSSNLKPAIFLLIWAPKLPGAARSLSDGRIKNALPSHSHLTGDIWMYLMEEFSMEAGLLQNTSLQHVDRNRDWQSRFRCASAWFTQVRKNL